MKKLYSVARDYIKKSDTLLLALCVIATIFGIVLVASATRYMNSSRYVQVQIIALILGIILYFLFSVIDVEIIADKSKFLFIFGALFLASLAVVGEAGDTGNRAWIRFGIIGVQPAEIVKVTFIIAFAHQMCKLKEERKHGINSPVSVLMLALHFGVLFGLIVIISGDLGSALVYLFIFIVMLFLGGLKFYWFLIGGGAVAAVFPYVWNNLLTGNQKDRILAPYDPSIDPSGLGITWQATKSKTALGSGQIFGQGLFHGAQTQSGSIPQQHTDFIYAVAGEELGLIGCTVIIILLFLIIIRCVYVGIKSNGYMGFLICIGIASMLIAQTLENIGMCIGVTPVIGLTLPFFSYGGSSIITLFASMGIVSGIKMRPRPGGLRRRSYY